MKHLRSRWVLDEVAPAQVQGRELDLITAAELAEIPDGTVLVSILGERFKAGKDRINAGDTRWGFLPVGYPVGWAP